MNPGPFTLRELSLMADGRSKAAWQHTSHLLWLVANVNRDPKRTPRPYTPADFNPHADRAKTDEPVATVNVADAKGLLMGMVGARKVKARPSPPTSATPGTPPPSR